MNMSFQSQNCITGGAGTKEWLDASAGWIVLASEATYAQDMHHRPMLSSAPLTESDIEIGRRIAKQYGLTA